MQQSQNSQWKEVQKHFMIGNYDQAYKQVFQMDDDTYLMRLMLITGPCVKKLSQQVAFQLAYKIKILLKSELWKQLGIIDLENLKYAFQMEQILQSRVKQRNRVTAKLQSL
ncbi:hypothetical protein pb186bvf_020386 [Paramecium bursaria]